MKSLSKGIQVFLFLFSALQVVGAQAELKKSIQFTAVIQKNDQLVNYKSVPVKAKILSPNHCVLREEQFSAGDIVDGDLTLVLGSGTATETDPGLLFKNVFDNFTPRTGLNCIGEGGSIAAGSYTPAEADGRILRLSFNVDNSWEEVDFEMRGESLVVNSEWLGGKAANEFMQINPAKNITQSKLEDLMTNSVLAGVLGGTFGGTATNATNAQTASTALVATTAVQLQTIPAGCPNGQYAIGFLNNKGDLNCASVGGSAAGPAGGDLSGTYPNPAIASNAVTSSKIANGALSAATTKFFSNPGPGYLLATDGTTGTTITSLGCGLGQTLVWQASGGFGCGDATNATNATNATTATTASNFSGSLNGDVTGNQGSTYLSKIQGHGVSAAAPGLNQVLQYNGSIWLPASLAFSAIDSGSKPTTLSGYGITDALSSAAIIDVAHGGTSATTPAGARAVLGIPWDVSTNDIYNTNTQNVGIGTGGAPTTGARLEVNGQILSKVYNAGSSTSIDWSNGNLQYTSANCGVFTFSNMLEGGSYTLIVTGGTQGTCTFSQGGITSFKFMPANDVTASGTHSIYSFVRANNIAYVSWITGFQ